MTTAPRLRRFVPPTPTEIAEREAAAEALRAQLAAERDAARPARRAAIASGPNLRDPEAAVDCTCSCHPRPASQDLHDGGVTCPCQRTDAELAVSRAALADRLAGWFDSDPMDERRRDRDERISAALADLAPGVEIDEIGGLAPFVIVGRVDGRGFYLRERHDLYQIVVAPDDDPAADAWHGPSTLDRIEVHAGCSSDLDTDEGFDEATALRVAVDQVRLFLLRRGCTHADAHRFCPRCGIDMAHAHRWRSIGS